MTHLWHYLYYMCLMYGTTCTACDKVMALHIRLYTRTRTRARRESRLRTAYRFAAQRGRPALMLALARSLRAGLSARPLGLASLAGSPPSRLALAPALEAGASNCKRKSPSRADFLAGESGRTENRCSPWCAGAPLRQTWRRTRAFWRGPRKSAPAEPMPAVLYRGSPCAEVGTIL